MQYESGWYLYAHEKRHAICVLKLELVLKTQCELFFPFNNYQSDQSRTRACIYNAVSKSFVCMTTRLAQADKHTHTLTHFRSYWSSQGSFCSVAVRVCLTSDTRVRLKM